MSSFNSKYIIFTMIILSLISLFIGYFFINNFYYYFLGLFYSTIFSILKLILLELTLKKSINMNPEKVASYVNLHYSIRYFLTAVFLFICIKRPDISTFGAVIGLFITKPSIYISKFLFKNFK